MRLTKRIVESLAPGDRDQFVWDADLKGFGLKVTPAGRRVYLLQYRMGGREAATRRWTIGPHGSPWTADTARSEALRIQTLVRQGIDPRAQEISRREEMATLEFGPYAVLFVERYLKARWKRGWGDAEHLLLDIAAPKWRGRTLPQIGRRDVSALLDTVSDRPGTARLLFATLRKLFNWAVERGDLQVSPLIGMKGPPPVRSRDRVLTDDELVAVWFGAEAIGWPFGPIFQLLIATGARRSEVAALEWREIEPSIAQWRLPGHRSKNGQPHVKPLNKVALRVLCSAPRVSDGLVFSVTGSTPPSGFSKAKRRLDSEAAAHLRRLRGLSDTASDMEVFPPWRLHDLRRTVATNLQRLGVRLEVTEAVQNRLSGVKAGVAGIYQRHDWAAEKVEALRLWSEQLNAIGIE